VRCKIFITKEFPAKSSRIRSYVTFRPLLAAFGLISPVPKGEGPGAPSAKRRAWTMFEGKHLRIIVPRRGVYICKPPSTTFGGPGDMFVHSGHNPYRKGRFSVEKRPFDPAFRM
jgi:hypothetical protein